MGTRILTVEDDERIRTAVKLALEDEGWTVDEAGSGEEAIDLFHQAQPDVVLIDIMLPGIDGFELCRTLRRHSDVPIVMVTARNDTHDVVAGLEAGADDYLVKPFAPEELVARLRALLRRARRPAAPAATAIAVKIGTAHLDLLSGELSGPGGQARLTEREAGLLLALARSGSPLSREATYRQVFQREWDPADRSLDVHIAHLRRKLESACGETGVIATVRGKGYELRLPANVVTLPANPT